MHTHSAGSEVHSALDRAVVQACSVGLAVHALMDQAVVHAQLAGSVVRTVNEVHSIPTVCGIHGVHTFHGDSGGNRVGGYRSVCTAGGKAEETHSVGSPVHIQ